MKKLMLLWSLMLMQMVSLACEVCKKQQPKVLRGITHGAGPASDWDYVIVGCMIVIVAVSLFYSIKWIVQPGEKQSEHIKHSILNLD